MSEPGTGIVLVGLPGSGKSAVARCLAERTGRRVIDTDALVHERTGRTPAEHITNDGQSAFRALEAAAVAAACAVPGTVVATGGGAILDPLNRWALRDHGQTVWLDAPDEVLASRLRGATEPRPLLDAPDRDALARLREARDPFYRASDLTVDASADPGTTAGRILEATRSGTRGGDGRLFDARVPREHPAGPPTARIVYGRDLHPSVFAETIGERPASVVADARAAAVLPALSGAIPAARRLLVRAGERSKRLRSVERILEWLSKEGSERGDPLVALGGGTLGDVAGFAAAIYARGVPLVQVPTTALAQADSALGGKVGVDLARAKNAAGAFWPPVAVIADAVALRTLPTERLRDGFAEALKAALIGDEALWRLLETRGRGALRSDEPARYAIVERAARVKLGTVARDPYEHGERRHLNLGHTVGHALEVESGYRLPHGTAVVLGIRAVARIAAGRGAEPDLAERIDDLAAALGFPLRRAFDAAAVRRAIRSDKKRDRGRQRWILPIAVGRVTEVDDVTERELAAALATIGDEA